MTMMVTMMMTMKKTLTMTLLNQRRKRQSRTGDKSMIKKNKDSSHFVDQLKSKLFQQKWKRHCFWLVHCFCLEDDWNSATPMDTTFMSWHCLQPFLCSLFLFSIFSFSSHVHLLIDVDVLFVCIIHFLFFLLFFLLLFFFFSSLFPFFLFLLMLIC